MKVFEVLSKHSDDFTDTFIITNFDMFEKENLGDFRVKISFTYDAHDDISYDIIETDEKVDQYDAEGDKLLKSWPKGTDISKLPGFNEDDVLEKLAKAVHDWMKAWHEHGDRTAKMKNIQLKSVGWKADAA